jgi:hypothetical protein
MEFGGGAVPGCGEVHLCLLSVVTEMRILCCILGVQLFSVMPRSGDPRETRQDVRCAAVIGRFHPLLKSSSSIAARVSSFG